ncbi:hypothetical protein EAF04_010191 [Stromatinia cepivora]|nr:hypothetical protein EAF04_010191 [Stromatinia cepivora]
MSEVNESIDPNERNDQISTSPILTISHPPDPELLASSPATPSLSPLYLQARLPSPTPHSYTSHASHASYISQTPNPSPSFPPQSFYPLRPHTPTPISSPRGSSPKNSSPKEEFPPPSNPSTQPQNSPETVSFQLWAINIQEPSSIQDCEFIEFRIEDLVDVSFEFLRKRVSDRVEGVVCGNMQGDEEEGDGKKSEDNGEDGDETPQSRRRRMDSIRRRVWNDSEDEVNIGAGNFGVGNWGSVRRRSERERRKGWDFEIYEDVVERGGDESVEMRGMREMRGLWERGGNTRQRVYMGENEENEGIGNNGVAEGVNGEDDDGEENEGSEEDGVNEDGTSGESEDGEGIEDREENETSGESEDGEENESSHGNEDTPEPEPNQPSISTETIEILPENQETISNPSNPTNSSNPSNPALPKPQKCHLTSLSIHWNPSSIPTEYMKRTHPMRFLSSKRASPPPLTFKASVSDEVEITREWDKEEDRKEINITEITPGFPTREKFAQEGSWRSGGKEDEDENEEEGMS